MKIYHRYRRFKVENIGVKIFGIRLYLRVSRKILRWYQDLAQVFDRWRNRVVVSGYFAPFVLTLLYKGRGRRNIRCIRLHPKKKKIQKKGIRGLRLFQNYLFDLNFLLNIFLKDN